MNVRDYVIEANRQIGEQCDAVFDSLGEGFEWSAPFMPWFVIGGIAAGFIVAIAV